MQGLDQWRINRIGGFPANQEIGTRATRVIMQLDKQVLGPQGRQLNRGGDVFTQELALGLKIAG